MKYCINLVVAKQIVFLFTSCLNIFRLHYQLIWWNSYCSFFFCLFAKF